MADIAVAAGPAIPATGRAGILTPARAAQEVEARRQKRLELTQSDRLLLARMPWCDEELNGVVRRQMKNPPSNLIAPALVAALFEMADSGAVRFEVRETRQFLGLFRGSALFVMAADAPINWPAGSLEKDLVKICRRIPHTARKVSDVIYDWIGATTASPRDCAIRGAMQSMAARGVVGVEIVVKRYLKLLRTKSRHYVLPGPRCPVLAEYQETWLSGHWRNSPELFNRLTEEIDKAFNRRTDSD